MLQTQTTLIMLLREQRSLTAKLLQWQYVCVCVCVCVAMK